MNEERAKQLKNALHSLFNDDYPPVLRYKLSELTIRDVKHKDYWYIEIHDWKKSQPHGSSSPNSNSTKEAQNP